VDATLVGARLEAYRESKESIYIFAKLSTESGEALAKIPTEVIDMVFKQLQESLFKERILWWQKADRCSRLECDCGREIEDEEWCFGRVHQLMSKCGESDYSQSEGDNFTKCREVQDLIMDMNIF